MPSNDSNPPRVSLFFSTSSSERHFFAPACVPIPGGYPSSFRPGGNADGNPAGSAFQSLAGIPHLFDIVFCSGRTRAVLLFQSLAGIPLLFYAPKVTFEDTNTGKVPIPGGYPSSFRRHESRTRRSTRAPIPGGYPSSFRLKKVNVVLLLPLVVPIPGGYPSSFRLLPP